MQTAILQIINDRHTALATDPAPAAWKQEAQVLLCEVLRGKMTLSKVREMAAHVAERFGPDSDAAQILQVIDETREAIQARLSTERTID